MNLRYFKNIIPVAAVAFAVAGLSSCTKDLDVTPIDPSSTMTPSEPELFTKCYATMAKVHQIQNMYAISTVWTVVPLVSSVSCGTPTS